MAKAVPSGRPRSAASSTAVRLTLSDNSTISTSVGSSSAIKRIAAVKAFSWPIIPFLCREYANTLGLSKGCNERRNLQHNAVSQPDDHRRGRRVPAAWGAHDLRAGTPQAHSLLADQWETDLSAAADRSVGGAAGGSRRRGFAGTIAHRRRQQRSLTGVGAAGKRIGSRYPLYRQQRGPDAPFAQRSDGCGAAPA